MRVGRAGCVPGSGCGRRERGLAGTLTASAVRDCGCRRGRGRTRGKRGGSGPSAMSTDRPLPMPRSANPVRRPAA